MLREKASREFQTINTSLAREIAAVYGRFPGGYNAREPVTEVFSRMLHYYGQHGIELGLTRSINENPANATISFITIEDEHFISINGALPNPFRFYLLSYRLNITTNITDMQDIQQYLWVTSIIVALVAAVLLYFILLNIFKPLEIVASAAGQITDGLYGQQIIVKGRNELAAVAIAFNRMSAQIESQIQELEEEAERKQQFVDNFAHEIRTPLTSIYGYAEYLQKANLSEGELIESAEYIMSEADHMKKVANSLLELATLRDYQPEINQIFIPELFIEIKQSLEKTLKQRNIELRIQAMAPYIEGQADLIKSLLVNLCTNAIASCEQSKGIIRLSASIENENIIISIDDNGCGIPSSKISKVTEPFFRVDKARSRSQGGVGLGLALCKQIAHVHGAKLTIASTLGIGTLVRLTFTSSK